MEKSQPVLFRILINDYLCFLSAITPIFIWFAYFMNRSGLDDFMLYISISVTSVAIPLLIWRIIYFFKLFKTGEETAAVIIGVLFFRGRGRVDYNYSYKGTDYTAGHAIMKNRRTIQLAPGQQIDILVNPDNPTKAVIQNLFI